MIFYLKFSSDDYGRKKIDEPIGFNDVDFNVRQEQGRMARDFTLNGDSIEFEFSYMRNHELDKLLYYFNKFGFESKVDLEIQLDSNNKYICELDFATAETDQLEYFKCKGLLVSEMQIVKRRKSVKVDLFSNKDIDGNYIAPLVPNRTLIMAMPLRQISKWNLTEPNIRYFQTLNGGAFFRGFNFANNLLRSEIEDTLSPQIAGSIYPNLNDFEIIYARNSLKNVNISISNLDIKSTITGLDGNPGSFQYSFYYVVGDKTLPINTYKSTLLASSSYISTNLGSYTNTNSYDFVIDEVPVGHSVFLYHSIYLKKSFSDYQLIRVEVNCKSMDVEVSVDSTSYSSVVPTVSLYDAMKQVVKSISGLEISAPKFQENGIYYGNRLMNGNALRNIPNKPFRVSLEDIEKGLMEMRCDYEITPDEKVFFGDENDFYPSNEIAFFENTQFSEMSVGFNPLYSVNEFHFKYKNFQSLKENTVAGTSSTIHGESRYVFFNKKVENKKIVEIEWTRDSLLLEELRKIGLKTVENTSTQDDDEIFILDSLRLLNDRVITENFILQHIYDSVNTRLVLKNDNSFNFIFLGIEVGNTFEIMPNDSNTAFYTVFSISSNEVQLTRVSAGSNGSNSNGIRQTRVSYQINSDTTNYINRNNNDFDAISNLNGDTKFYNLRYSIGRNINNFWKRYLSTVNFYWLDKPINNTWYKENSECITIFENVYVKENQAIVSTSPIVTPKIYDKMIFSNVEFAEYVDLQNNLRISRGYIRTIDNNNKVIKVFPTDISYSLLDRELIIKGEEKYEPKTLRIVTEINYIQINEETIVQSLDYEIIKDKVYIYDSNRYLLYTPVYWNEVCINNGFASSIAELSSWLDLV